MLTRIINEEHIRRSKEWKPQKTPAWYAMLDYFQKIGYNEETAASKATEFCRG